LSISCTRPGNGGGHFGQVMEVKSDDEIGKLTKASIHEQGA